MVVGAGGEGVVHRAVRLSPLPRMEVSVKIIRHNPHRSAGDLERQLAQVEIARTLRSPAIVPILEGFIVRATADGPEKLVLVSPWVEGVDLVTAAKNASDPGAFLGGLAILAKTLDDMHGGRLAASDPIIHGDVKPSNILVSPHGHAQLIDLGLARAVGPGHPGLGTVGFTSPDIAKGHYGPSTDRFGFVSSVRSAIGELPSANGLLRRPTLTKLLSAESVAESSESLESWLTRVRTKVANSWSLGRHPRRLGAVLVGAAALAIAGGLGASFAGAATDCNTTQFQSAADAADLPWHDPDKDCLHSVYELMTTESPPDISSPVARTPSPAQQLADLPPQLLSCDPDAWEALAVERSNEPLRQSWLDSDQDCLHNVFELNALGLDPMSADTDGDGVHDTFDTGRSGLSHDPLTQLLYVDRIAGIATRSETVDSVACSASTFARLAEDWIRTQESDKTWLDSDGDCMSDEYEIRVLGSDPFKTDSDADGISDGIDPDLTNGLLEPVDLQLEDSVWQELSNAEQADRESLTPQPRSPDS